MIGGGCLVAQSSATGVTVAATPPCSAIRFRNPKMPRYPPPARRDTPPPLFGPLLATGVRRKVRHLDLGGVWRDFGATSLILQELDATLYARHCVPRLGSPHGCATKGGWQKPSGTFWSGFLKRGRRTGRFRFLCVLSINSGLGESPLANSRFGYCEISEGSAMRRGGQLWSTHAESWSTSVELWSICVDSWSTMSPHVLLSADKQI